MPTGGVRKREDICAKADFPSVTATGARAFIDRRRGQMQKQHNQF